ncbi:VWA domain-containing protein [Flavobacterium amnicola]|uniref:VWA domain-containing protein n=1 Tax=Flavobacterium amnicola TaxID=2506422 RepID=A0A4Q1K2Y9_9FLAO|nr:BatA and WFA domain-containing protein [Flavobacterium amnicola]RXR19109.1 VWA domain-containing protein [Flavobacterium amnicola]
MQFKHPEILYFLFLLVIPILVHLFQLRKFKIEYFTNVKLLKELSIQTRKSSKIKKYLLLATRLLLLTALIIAFAQPFFAAKDSKSKNNELYVILDNSFSMQAKGQKGELLKRAVQDLLEKTPENVQLSIVTNSEEFWNTSIKNIQKELQNLSYSAIPFSLENALTKVKSHNSNNQKDIVIITDAIGLKTQSLANVSENTKTYFVIPEAEKLENIAIDSVFVAQSLENFYEIGVNVSSNFEEEKSIPVSMFNNESLIAKAILKLNKRKQTLSFTIPKAEFNGYITLNDNSLAFDNTFYFSISKPSKVNVLSIGENEKSTFLSKIYTQPDFNYQNVTINALDYSKIPNQDAIILNELDNIPLAMHTNLKKFIEKGGNLVFIPSVKNDLQNINSFLANFGNLQFVNLQNQDKKITKINFANPLFANVFEKKISNFQYPSVKQSFGVKSSASQAITYEDQTGFLNSIFKNSGAVFIFSAPINKENSNFQNSPLIVPTFYKMGSINDKNGVKFETIGNSQSVLVPAVLSKDEVVSIKNNSEEFIPMQQIMDDKVKISCGDNPKKAGNYEIVQYKKSVGTLSFNYDRKESALTSPSSESIDQINQIDSLESFFDTIEIERTDNQIWKWFLIFTLIFLFLEILIQKFIK